MQGVDFIFSIAILIMSVVIHEVSHGYAANALGDLTARYAGRLTLNPLKHLDLFGSIILPAMTYLLGGFIFGWAKPVPYNPYNLRNQKWGPAVVGVAGPLSNIFIALVFGFLIRFGASLILASQPLFQIMSLIVFVNLILAVFNLIPIPPLDGSKVLLTLLPYSWRKIEGLLERYGLILLLIFILFLWRLLIPLVVLFFRLITGINF